MTTTLAPELKSPRLDAASPTLQAIPALLVDHVTKRFTIGRHKKPVVAVDDVRRLGEEAKVINDRYTPRTDFFAEFTQDRRVNNRPMASMQEPYRQVPYITFGPAAAIKPGVCEQHSV